MTAQGKRYATFVRRAGFAWGKGQAQQAIAALEEGITLARQNGDTAMALVLQQDMERYQRAVAGEDLDLSQ